MTFIEELREKTAIAKEKNKQSEDIAVKAFVDTQLERLKIIATDQANLGKSSVAFYCRRETPYFAVSEIPITTLQKRMEEVLHANGFAFSRESVASSEIFNYRVSW